MFYVVSFEGRCMGFCPTAAKAQDIVNVLGQGAKYEEEQGPFPTDEYTAARAWEKKQIPANVVALRPSEDAVTVELTSEELNELKDALCEESDVMDEDPWAEQTSVSFVAGPGQSGFFTPAQGVG